MASAATTLSQPRLFLQSTHHKSSSFRFLNPPHKQQLREYARLVIVSSASSPKKRRNKNDTHSFVPKPEEATGLYPEAVLLKKKVVKEDGKVLPEFEDVEEEKLYEFLTLEMESDFNLERMRHYEVVYLIHEDHIDEVESVTSKVQDFVREKKGRIWRLNNWGLRRLAYKIRKAKNAVYILMNFEIDAKFINDFKSMLDKDERIIRHLVMKQDKAITEDCPPPPEWHTVRAEQGYIDEDDEDADEGNLDDEDWDDEAELEMAEEGDIDEDYDQIIIVEDEDDKKITFTSKKSKLNLKKAAR